MLKNRQGVQSIDKKGNAHVLGRYVITQYLDVKAHRLTAHAARTEGKDQAGEAESGDSEKEEEVIRYLMEMAIRAACGQQTPQQEIENPEIMSQRRNFKLQLTLW